MGGVGEMTPKKDKPDAEPAPVAPTTNQISDVIWQALIAAFLAAFLGYLQYLTSEKLNSIAKTGESTHVLVNSGMTIQLQLVATALRRVADMQRDRSDAVQRDPETTALQKKEAAEKAAADEEAAMLAERTLHEHEEKQIAADGGMKVAPRKPAEKNK